VIRVLMVDDHTLLRDGMRAMLRTQTDIEVIGEASNGREALEKVIELNPDLVILDISMPVIDGLEAARQIKKRSPNTKILVLTQHDNKEYLLASVEAGVSGYVPKRALSSELISAIRTVSEGNHYWYSDAGIALVAKSRHQTNRESLRLLTANEKQILKLVASGCTCKLISEQMGLKLSTVENHCKKIKKKLGVRNQADLVKFALRKGLVDINT
jgi:DNA-binding NarL/FixJ family response regulator